VFPWLPLLKQFWNDPINPLRNHKNCYYLATDGTIHGNIKHINVGTRFKSQTPLVILTTYVSAPELYQLVTDQNVHFDMLIHDEAHHIESANYKKALDIVSVFIRHTVNLSATLACESSDIHFKYSLLRGTNDKVVRDFKPFVIQCVKSERDSTALLVEMVQLLIEKHEHVKLMIYTNEAETDNSSVRTFISSHADTFKQKGWWIEGLNSDTMKEKDTILKHFQQARPVSILVSCKSISEGVDLRNANCMLSWDPSQSTVVNIQRIGRIVRRYKDEYGNDLSEEQQLPSTVLIPVFLDNEKYIDLKGDKEKIHEALSEEIGKHVNGDYMPFIAVMTALRSELADEDEYLMEHLLNYPPRVNITKSLVDCLGKKLKKNVDDILAETADYLEQEEENKDNDDDQ
jgi:superfamily II DNA or RNA helicase